MSTSFRKVDLSVTQTTLGFKFSAESFGNPMPFTPLSTKIAFLTQLRSFHHLDTIDNGFSSAFFSCFELLSVFYRPTVSTLTIILRNVMHNEIPSIDITIMHDHCSVATRKKLDGLSLGPELDQPLFIDKEYFPYCVTWLCHIVPQQNN